MPHVAQQETTTRDKLVLVAGGIRDVGVSKAAEWAQVREVRLAAIEGLKGRTTTKSRGRKNVLEMCGV
jgi:hypothetical protein